MVRKQILYPTAYPCSLFNLSSVYTQKELNTVQIERRTL